jgi:hypothetical protein
LRLTEDDPLEKDLPYYYSIADDGYGSYKQWLIDAERITRRLKVEKDLPYYCPMCDDRFPTEKEQLNHFSQFHDENYDELVMSELRSN